MPKPTKFRRSKIGIKRMLAQCGSITNCKANLPSAKMLDRIFSKPIPKRMRKHIMVAKEFWPAFRRHCDRINKIPRLYDLLMAKKSK